MVDFNLTADQEDFRGIVARFCTENLPLTEVRRIEDAGEPYSEALWERMARLDWVGLGIPEEYGGSGSGLTDLVVLYHQLGRALATTPHLESAVVAADILARAGTPAGLDLLPQVAAGTTIVVPALLEEDGMYGEDDVQLAIVDEGAGYRLRGTKLLVPFGGIAQHLLVAGRLEGGDGVSLVLVDTAADGVSVALLPNLGGYPLYAVTLDTTSPKDRLLGQPGQGWELVQAAHDKARVLRSAQIGGAGEKLLELAVDYAKFREQFGNPIGKYQAVQYLCTDMAIDVELIQLHALSTAGRFDAGLPIELEASRTKAYASRAARRLANRVHEVFAGLAFMIESDIQLFSRRLKHWELDMGDDHDHFTTCGRILRDRYAVQG